MQIIFIILQTTRRRCKEIKRRSKEFPSQNADDFLNENYFITTPICKQEKNYLEDGREDDDIMYCDFKKARRGGGSKMLPVFIARSQVPYVSIILS